MIKLSAIYPDFATTLKQAMVAVCAALFLVHAPVGYAAAQGDAAVRVTGRGETAYEARQDAVRQALQQTIEQLVISQQVVKNDRLTRDKIISTMNGFVSQFTPVRRYSDNGIMVIEADVIVSKKRVENFVGLEKGNRANIKSENIIAAAQAEKLARTIRAEIAIAMLQDLSGDMLEISSAKFAPNQDNPDMLDMTVEIDWSHDFIESVYFGLRGLAKGKYRGLKLLDTGFDWPSKNPYNLAICPADIYTYGCYSALVDLPALDALKSRGGFYDTDQRVVTGRFAVQVKSNGNSIGVFPGHEAFQIIDDRHSPAGSSSAGGQFFIQLFTEWGELTVGLPQDQTFIIRGTVPVESVKGASDISITPQMQISFGASETERVYRY
jgi:hypothetical protein